MTNEQPEDAPYAFSGLHRVFHEPSRLGILSSLATHEDGLVFNDLKHLVGLTDSNLSRQIQTLEEEKLVTVEKKFVGKRPQTRCKMTASGRERFVAYIAEIERVVRTSSPPTTRASGSLSPSARRLG